MTDFCQGMVRRYEGPAQAEATSKVIDMANCRYGSKDMFFRRKCEHYTKGRTRIQGDEATSIMFGQIELCQTRKEGLQAGRERERDFERECTNSSSSQRKNTRKCEKLIVSRN